ncbi:ApaG protein [Rhizobium leguminosarum]|nr:ApaG protein [Rhizobium leguminosarum]MDH6663303.1 ApaG protein [Rhizobium sophorae]MBB4332763.1 ApaG protein [Rhizobium leguminosarum]MBB4345688.1 ApaG protein [Rhizobium leguminosarum]MBB4358306.1 ApaG protein [Rhizobium leguminosarum]
MTKVQGMYRALTRDIEVVVEPFYLEEQSDPDDDRYVWGYRIVISNNSGIAVRLVNRYWNITDQNGQVDEVTGPGVVGEQPRLSPGDTYEYSSGCPLDTPSGLMFGHYQMETDEGEMFDVDIPAFSLDSPGLLRVLN